MLLACALPLGAALALGREDTVRSGRSGDPFALSEGSPGAREAREGDPESKGTEPRRSAPRADSLGANGPASESDLPVTESGLVALASSDAEAWKRAAALRELARLPDESAARADALAAVGRSDPSAEVREAAAVALGELAAVSPGEVASRVAHLAAASLVHESDDLVRAELVAAIQDTRDGAVVDELIARLADPAPGVRDAAAEALGRVAWTARERARAALARRLAGERDETVRSGIAAAIAAIDRES